MKSFIAFVAIALFASFIMPSESVKSCVIRCNTASTTEVCARSTSTGICRRFTNGCAHKLYDCVNGRSNVAVALSQCRSIAVGFSGTCRATTSTSGVSTSSISNSLSSLYGNYGSFGGFGSSSVTPIVIRV